MPMVPENGALEHGLELGDLRNRRLPAGAGGIERRIGADAALLQGDGAVERLLVERFLRLAGLEVRLLHGIVQPYQFLSPLDLFVGLEQDLLDDAGGLDGQVDAAGGRDGSDGLDVRGPCDRLDPGGRHRQRVDRHVGEEILDCLVAEKIEADDAAADNHEQDECDDEALDQGNPSRSSVLNSDFGQRA
jgi:hypothetical protein